MPKLLTTWFEANDLVIVLGPSADLLSVIQGNGASKKDLAARAQSSG